MKKFEIPEINISLFDADVTADLSQTATEKAQQALGNEGVSGGNTTTVNGTSGWNVTF